MAHKYSMLRSQLVIPRQHAPTIFAFAAASSRPLAQVLAWAAQGAIRPYVSHRFALSDYREAMKAKWTGAVVGGAVLHP